MVSPPPSSACAGADAKPQVLNYSADVVCLQDADMGPQFWLPRLGLGGYDAAFHRRTSHGRPRGPTAEGVLVAWDRDLFSLAKTEVS